MWELDCEGGWEPKNWCFWTVVLEKAPGNPLDCREIQLVHSEGDQPWDFFGRNDAKAETPVLWPRHAKGWPGAIGGRRRRGRQKMRWLDGITDSMTWVWVKSGSWWWTARPGVLQLLGRKESDMTEGLNWTEQPCPPRENWITDLLNKTLPIRTRPSFPHSQSLPAANFHKPLILISGRTEWKSQS